MPYFTYDTSVFISRKLTDFLDMPQSFLLSAVVLMELIASAKDNSRRRFYEQIYQRHRQNNSLMVPNDDDWILASKILYLLTHARRRSHQGNLQRLPPGASQRLALDVSDRGQRSKVESTSSNRELADFKAIQRYCNTTIVKAANFFQK